MEYNLIFQIKLEDSTKKFPIWEGITHFLSLQLGELWRKCLTLNAILLLVSTSNLIKY